MPSGRQERAQRAERGRRLRPESSGSPRTDEHSSEERAVDVAAWRQPLGSRYTAPAAAPPKAVAPVEAASEVSPQLRSEAASVDGSLAVALTAAGAARHLGVTVQGLAAMRAQHGAGIHQVRAGGALSPGRYPCVVVE